MHTEQSERVRLAETLGSAPRDVYPLRVKSVRRIEVDYPSLEDFEPGSVTVYEPEDDAA